MVKLFDLGEVKGISLFSKNYIELWGEVNEGSFY